MKEISRRDFLKGSVAGALGLAAASFVLPSAVAFADSNTYTATAKGFAGPVTVTATIDGDKITAVTAEGPNETPDRGGVAGRGQSGQRDRVYDRGGNHREQYQPAERTAAPGDA